MDGKEHCGASAPEIPALHIPDPLSITTADPLFYDMFMVLINDKNGRRYSIYIFQDNYVIKIPNHFLCLLIFLFSSILIAIFNIIYALPPRKLIQA